MSAQDLDADRAGDASIPDARRPLRILVAEDEGLIALNLELILRRLGCEIIGPISEMDDIVAAARKYQPDGAFLDVNLRGRKVFDVLPEMMSLEVPCVLSSGYDDPMLFPAPFRNMPRIAKPFDEAVLRRACAEFEAIAEARRAVARQDEERKDYITESRAVAFPTHRRRSTRRAAVARDKPRAVANAR